MINLCINVLKEYFYSFKDSRLNFFSHIFGLSNQLFANIHKSYEEFFGKGHLNSDGDRKIEDLSSLATKKLPEPESVIDLLWPMPASDQPEDNSFFLDRVIDGAIERLNQNPEDQKNEPQEPAKIDISPIHRSLLKINQYVIAPWVMSTMPELSFNEAIHTTEAIQNTLEKKKGSKNRLESFINTSVYRGSIVAVAYSVNHLTQQQFSTPLMFLTASIGASPYLQERFEKLPCVKKINATIYESALSIRSLLKKPIHCFVKGKLQNALENNRKALTEAINQTKEENIDPIANNLKVALGPVGSSVCSTIWDRAIAKPCEEKLARGISKSIEKTADVIASNVVDLSFIYLKNLYETKLLQTGICKLYTVNPIMASVAMIMSGGTEQTVSSLCRRVAGASLLYFTGSAALGIGVIYVPFMLQSFIDLRNDHLTKMGFAEESMAQFAKKCTYYSLGWKVNTNNHPNVEIEKIITINLEKQDDKIIEKEQTAKRTKRKKMTLASPLIRQEPATTPLPKLLNPMQAIREKSGSQQILFPLGLKAQLGKKGIAENSLKHTTNSRLPRFEETRLSFKMEKE